MKIIEKEGKSTSSVISAFMNEFNLTLDDFTFKVTDEGSSGFLHLFGSRPVKIQFTLPEITDDIINITENILKLMNISYKEALIKEEKSSYFIDITGVEEAGFLIGKAARLLDNLQYLISQMLNKKYKRQIRLHIDVNNYRQRKRYSLLARIKGVVNRVKTQQKNFTFEPLNSADRKIIHKYIEKEKNVRTMTIGGGNLKKVVIMPVPKEKRGSNKNSFNKTA